MLSMLSLLSSLIHCIFFFSREKRGKRILDFHRISEILKRVFSFLFFFFMLENSFRREEGNKLVRWTKESRELLERERERERESCWKIKSWHPWQFFIYRVVRLMLLLRNGQLPPSSMVIYRFASPLTPTYTSLPAKERGWKAIKPAVNSALLFAQRCAKRGPAL